MFEMNQFDSSIVKTASPGFDASPADRRYTTTVKIGYHAPMSSKRSTFRQVATYLLVGGSNALIELIVFQVLFTLGNLSIVISNITAVVASTAFNFIMNGTVTFKEASNLPRAIILYLLLLVFNTIFSTSVIAILTNSGVPSFIAKLFTMACTVTWNFALYKRVVFK